MKGLQMTVSAPHGFVTSPGWFVSSVGPYQGAHRLNVSRIDPRQPDSYRTLSGDHDGRVFATSEAAHAFAADHGYLAPHVRSGAVWRACHRQETAYYATAIVEHVKAARSRHELGTIADHFKAWAIGQGCDLLDAQRYGLAPYDVARRLRPDLTVKMVA